MADILSGSAGRDVLFRGAARILVSLAIRESVRESGSLGLVASSAAAV